MLVVDVLESFDHSWYCCGSGFDAMSRRPAEQPATTQSQTSTTSSVTSTMTSFVGCMRNVRVTCDASPWPGVCVQQVWLQTVARYGTSPWPGVHLYRATGVERQCRDACSTSTSPRHCAHSGRCTNNYVTPPTCDCYGTGFEGPRCRNKGLS